MICQWCALSPGDLLISSEICTKAQLIELYEEQLRNYQSLVELLSTIVPQAFGSEPLVDELAYRRARCASFFTMS